MAGALTAAIAAAFSGSAVVSDPYFEYTTLLLPGNGTNGAQNNTFLDGSTNNFTITRNGQTTQGTFSPFSQTGWGGAFNTSTTYLTVTDTANLRFGSSNFTIEAWVYRNASGATQTIASKGASTPTGWVFQISSADKLVFTDTSTSITGTTSIAANTWTYVAVVRAGTGSNQTTLYINGTSDGTGTSATNFNQTSNMLVGADRSTTNFANGYISNLRLSNTNRTISSTPTTALTADANTIFLSLNLNRFQYTDSTAAYTNISVTGTPSVVAFSPFNPTASWSAATYGGSGYFDGNGDYLTAPSNTVFAFGTGNLTIEAWIYVTATNSQNINILTTASPTNFAFYINSSLQFGYWNGSVVQTIGSTNAISLNTWVHVAYVRNGSTLTAYANGASVGSISDSTNLSNNKAISICAYDGATSSYTAYISNLRVIKGTAVYTGAFTPPTAPITDAGSTSAASYPSTTNVNTSFASSATSLLLNFTNAGIYDATSKNDLETVGNAQISTTQSKWGGSSISFDGTGDYLAGVTKSSVYFNLTGDFTIETWAYFTTVATGFAGIVSWADSSGFNGWELINNAGTVYFRFLTGSAGVGQVTASSAISANQWYYISVIRSGSTITLYINGSSVGSTSYSGSQTSESSFLKVGADRVGTTLMTGYLQDMRISKYVRPTTVPTAAFPTL